MDNNGTPKINIIYKGIKERVSAEERKSFDAATSKIIENRDKIVWNVPSTECMLEDGSGENIGTMYLWENDPELPDDVKMKMVIVDDFYKGSGAVYALYNRGVETARRLHKNFVLDCKAGAAAFKSFKKFAEQESLPIVENTKNTFNEKTNSYEAPNGEWTLKIIL